MKNNFWKKATAFFLIILFLLLPTEVLAEDGAGSLPEQAVVAGFKPLKDNGAVTVEYKLALVTLEKRLPAQLSVLLEGEKKYRKVPVTWQCVEDYDEVYDTYHFEPVLDGYTIAEGTEVPVVSVHVAGESVIPSFADIEDNSKTETPVPNLRKLRGSTLPSSYDSFDEGRLPAVRNQAPYGSCWAFSSIGTVEADLIADGDADTDIDLSELHLAYYAYHSYYDEKGCGVGDIHDYTDLDYLNAGGSQQVAITVLSNMVGPADEETIPYEWGNDYNPGPFDGRAFRDVQLENAYAISAVETSAVKAAILEHGAVSASIYWNNDYYSYTYNSLYCPKRHFTNHAIMLVGWDDSFSRNNFSGGTPDVDGAWLVRNSWGMDDYGREGYFWLSYADPSFLNEDVYVLDAVSGKYDHCYSYATIPDSLDYYEFEGSVTAVQHFIVDGGEEITAVGFETKKGGLDVQIEVSLGGQKANASVSVNYPGYYTLELSEPIIVNSRSDVTLTMEYEGDNIQVYTEHAGTLSYSAETSTGFCGSGGLVLNGYNTSEDGLVKLLTVDCDVPGEEGVRINAENFPDNAFRNYVSSSFDLDRNGYLSDDEVEAVTVIDFVPAEGTWSQAGVGNGSFKTPGPVKSLSGISFFTELKTLRCAGNRLTALDVSRNTKLQELYCDDNKIESLDLSSNTALGKLSCAGNLLTELDVSNCQALVELFGNTLPDLDVYTIIFSDDDAYLAFDMGVNLTPSLYLGDGVPIDETAFPDAVFRSYVASHCDIDRDGTLADPELSAVKYIDCSGSDNGSDKIASLDGIELFTSLEKLLCGNNLLTGLDLSGNSALQELHCSGNSLEQLNLSGNNDLLELHCSGNSLEQLDLSGNGALQVLDCHDNPALTALDLDGCAELVKLDCSGTGLTVLYLNYCSSLEEVNCGGCLSLEELEVPGCNKLRILYCGSTQVPKLDLSGYTNLANLECGSNTALTSVNVYGCTSLNVISCNDCPQLSSLDIRGCGDLEKLDCRNGNLSQLNLGDCQWLGDLSCYGNRIGAIDLTPSYTLSGIVEYYEPVVENGIAFYNYEGHKIAFDADVILVNIEPDFVLPAALKNIGKNAFKGCKFRYVVLPEQIECIGANAFAGCRNLLCIRIPGSTTQIDDQAFGSLTGIVIFGVPGSTAEAFAQAHGYFFIPIE